MVTKKHIPMTKLLEIDDATNQHLCRLMAQMEGDSIALESALGALVLGQHYGTRALQMIHSPATLRKYEKILGIKYSDHGPARTSMSTKIRGIKVADKLGAFWKVVMGHERVEKKHYAEK
jgi:hypothetical protein